MVARLSLERHTVDAVLRGKGLQLAVAVLGAGEAVEGMACQQQLDDRAPRVDHPGAAGLHLHALLNGERAGGDEGRLALHLDDAHATRAAGEELLDVAERGDLFPAAWRASRIDVPAPPVSSCY